MISIMYGVGQAQPFPEECLWSISSKCSFWATPLLHFGENGLPSTPTCTEERNSQDAGWNTGLLCLIVAGGLYCRHVKTKALNALSVKLGILFQLRRCSFPNTRKEHRAIRRHQVFWRRGTRAVFSTKPHSIFSDIFKQTEMALSEQP